MKRIPMRICEKSDYDAQVTFLSSIVERHRKLPENPFLGTSLAFRFDEFDWTMSGEFWETVQCLAGQSLDDDLILAVLDPDPVSYFKSNFGYYEWNRLPVDMTKKQYWDFINQAPADSPADSILGVAERIVWVPQSRNWCIWAERESGLCVLASSSTYIWGNSRGIDWALDWCRPWANTAYLERFELNFKGR